MNPAHEDDSKRESRDRHLQEQELYQDVQDLRAQAVIRPENQGASRPVEDLDDRSGQPEWSNGANRIASGAHSPAQFPSSEAFSAMDIAAVQSTEDVSTFNAAQIPHNLQPLRAESQNSRQVPIETIIDQTNGDTEISNPRTDGQDLYEHQNMADDHENGLDFTAPILAETEFEASLRDTEITPPEADESIIIHEEADLSGNPAEVDFGSTSEEDFLNELDYASSDKIGGQTSDMVGIEDVPDSPAIPSSASLAHVDIGSTPREMLASNTSRVQEDDSFEAVIATIEGRKSQVTATPGEAAPMSPDAKVTRSEKPTLPTGTSEALDIPDDLDEDDFDIDTELDAEFAAMEAAFNQKLDLGTNTAPMKSEVSGTTDSTLVTPQAVQKEKYVSPYMPKEQSVQVSQGHDSLFTPAQVTRAANSISSEHNVFNPRSPSIGRGNSVPGLARPVEKVSNAPSFVSGKAAYSDPYALPDVFVQKNRPRPQAQILRAAASVPNFRADQTANMAQRNFSNQSLPRANPYNMPPPVRTQSTQSAMAREQPQHFQQGPVAGQQVLADSNPSLPANASFVRGDMMRGPQNDYNSSVLHEGMQNRKYSHSHNAETRVFSTHGPVIPPSGNPSLPSHENVRTSHTYGPARLTPAAPTLYQSMPPPPRGPSPLRAETVNSVDAVMRGRPSPLNHDPGTFSPMISHNRDGSMTSTVSHDSRAPHDAALGDYLHEQRAAENRMFDDSYAVAENEIYEAQYIQRTGSSVSLAQPSPVQNSFPSRSLERPQSQPRALPIKQSLARTTYAPRSSLDDKSIRASIQMSRSSSKAGEENYANTEPANSPRQSYMMAHDAQGSFGRKPLKRPAPITRATSSSHAYPSFDSPQASPAGQNFPSSDRATRQVDPASPHPIVRFAFGGKLLTSVPRTVPRFAAGGTMIQQFAGPGPVSITSVKDLCDDDILSNFPGPLLHGKNAAKQRKADVQLWLAQRVPPGNPQTQDDKTILYRLMMLMLELGSPIDSGPLKERLIMLLQPDMSGAKVTTNNDMANFRVVADAKTDHEVDTSSILSTCNLTTNAVETLSDFLLMGNKDAALRYACDKGLWAHAMVIASKISPQAWSAVVVEFASAELHEAQEASDSLKFLYQSFAGNTLHPPFSHSGSFPTTNWRKSLAMVLNNRGPGDDAALVSLGSTLLTNGQIYAAHLCFLLCSKPLIGAAEDGKSLLSLIGAHDIAGPGPLDNEAFILSEIYEFTQTLAQPKFAGFPHLLAIKLQRAALLADAGVTATAKAYCEAITNSLKALPKTSNLHHVLVERLRELTLRLDHSSGEEVASWITKPKIDVLSSLQGKFSKFVAGEDDEPQIKEDSVKGPFARLAQTPAISRVQSSADMRKPQALSTQYNGAYEADLSQTQYMPTQNHQDSYPYPPGDQTAPYTNSQMAWQAIDQRLPSGLAAQSAQAQHRYSPVVSRQASFSAAVPKQYTPMATQGVPAQQYFPAQPVNASQGPTQPSQASIYAATPMGGQAVSSQYNSVHLHQSNDVQSQVSTSNPLTGADVHDSAEAKQLLQSGVERTGQETDVKSQTDKSSSSPTAAAEDKKDATTDEKKSSWLGGWFGGKKKEVAATKDGEVKVHKAKLGEGMSLVYDPVTKKWTNPKGAMPDEGKGAAPPPPMAKKTSAAPPTFSAQGPGPDPASRDLQNASLQPQTISPLPSAAKPATVSRKLPNADEDLAAMLGNGPVPRRAASSGTPGPPSGAGSMRAKKNKPAKRYVDVFQEEA